MLSSSSAKFARVDSLPGRGEDRNPAGASHLNFTGQTELPPDPHLPAAPVQGQGENLERRRSPCNPANTPGIQGGADIDIQAALLPRLQ